MSPTDAVALAVVRAQLACQRALAEEMGDEMTLAETIRVLEQAEHVLAVEGEQEG